MTLEGFKEVQRVEFHAAKEQFEVEYQTDAAMGDVFRQAVLDVVIFPEVRKFLGDVGGKLHNSASQSS